MAYTDQTTIQTYIHPKDLTAMLDDDRDGLADEALLDAIIATCSLEVDGYLANIYNTPFATPAPSKVRVAATVFCCEALYARRLTPDEKNPFSATAKLWRGILQKIGEEGIGLDVGVDRAFVPGAAVTIPIVMNANSL